MKTRLIKKSLEWDSDGESWSESEGLSSSDVREHNEESLAFTVMGQNGSGEQVSLFLEDWELARVALSHIALDMLCQEMQEACCHRKACPSLTVDGL